MIIGSTSRIVNSRQAIKTVYWRVTNGKNESDKKIIKYDRTIKLRYPVENSPLKVNSDLKFEKFNRTGRFTTVKVC